MSKFGIFYNLPLKMGIFGVVSLVFRVQSKNSTYDFRVFWFYSFKSGFFNFIGMFWSCFPIFQGVRADLVANFYLKSVDFGPVKIMHFTVKMVNLVIFFKNMDFKIQRWLVRKIIIFTKLVRKLDLYLKKRLL